MKVKSEREVAQSTLLNPVDCSPPGSSIHGIFQARVLEWGAIAFSISLWPNLTSIHDYWKNHSFDSILGPLSKTHSNLRGRIPSKVKKNFYVIQNKAVLLYPLHSKIGFLFTLIRVSQVAQMVKNLPAIQDTWFLSWVRKIPGVGNDYPLQYSCLENSMDKED